jgi:hypothetical protein
MDAAPNRGDDQVDEIDSFLATGANEGIYMPPLGDPASHGQQAGRPMSCTQRLRFGGGSQETPPEAAATEPNPANIFSPTTLHKAVDDVDGFRVARTRGTTRRTQRFERRGLTV